jgi:hypothetical protein
MDVKQIYTLINSVSGEIAKELQLRRDNWRKNIIFALVREITTSIYE